MMVHMRGPQDTHLMAQPMMPVKGEVIRKQQQHPGIPFLRAEVEDAELMQEYEEPVCNGLHSNSQNERTDAHADTGRAILHILMDVPFLTIAEIDLDKDECNESRNEIDRGILLKP